MAEITSTSDPCNMVQDPLTNFHLCRGEFESMQLQLMLSSPPAVWQQPSDGLYSVSVYCDAGYRRISGI